MPTLAAIRHYPVKSCRGWDLDTALVEPWGLAHDRRWLVTDPHGRFFTAREHRKLLLVEPRVTADGGLELSAPGMETLVVAVPESEPFARTEVTVWQSTVDAMPIDETEPHEWFGELLGTDAQLVYLDDPTLRPTNPEFSRSYDRVSFADGYPLLAATTSSLVELNAWVAAGKRPADGPISMINFRPNLVIDGTEAWEEDGWRRLRVGDAEFLAVKGCSRCAITTTDPETIARDKEPLASLARHRRWDGETWFGMNLIPADPTARPTIRIGDEVEILEAIDAPDGPPR